MEQVLRQVMPPLVLVAMLGGLLLWLLQPSSINPGAQFGDAASIAGGLILFAAWTGIAAMATVQVWKVLLQPRAAFHEQALKTFFGKHAAQVLGLAAPASSQANPTMMKANEDAQRYLLDNPTEVVMGQIRAAADYILLRPEGFEEALRRLAGEAGSSAVTSYIAAAKEKSETDDDLLAAVRFFVEQHLNLIHVTLTERWRRQVRVTAGVVAGLATLPVIILADLGPVAKISVLFAGAVWGGFFAWFARDLVALVERRRG